MEEGSPSKKVRLLGRRAAEFWVAGLPPNRRVEDHAVLRAATCPCS